MAAGGRLSGGQQLRFEPPRSGWRFVALEVGDRSRAGSTVRVGAIYSNGRGERISADQQARATGDIGAHSLTLGYFPPGARMALRTPV
jgi:hypothetical protein